jgi:hypothetical protein
VPSESAVTADALRTALRPDRTVLAVFAVFLGLFVAYYFQFLLGGPIPGLDTLLAVVNAPVEMLVRWVGPGVVPDTVGLVVFLGYYYLLAVAVAWLVRRGRLLLG